MVAPNTSVVPHTPLTPYGSASRGISGSHDSNVRDFDDSSLSIIHKNRDKLVFSSFKALIFDVVIILI